MSVCATSKPACRLRASYGNTWRFFKDAADVGRRTDTPFVRDGHWAACGLVRTAVILCDLHRGPVSNEAGDTSCERLGENATLLRPGGDFEGCKILIRLCRSHVYEDTIRLSVKMLESRLSAYTQTSSAPAIGTAVEG